MRETTGRVPLFEQRADEKGKKGGKKGETPQNKQRTGKFRKGGEKKGGGPWVEGEGSCYSTMYISSLPPACFDPLEIDSFGMRREGGGKKKNSYKKSRLR